MLRWHDYLQNDRSDKVYEMLSVNMIDALQGISTAKERCGAAAKRTYEDMTLCTC